MATERNARRRRRAANALGLVRLREAAGSAHDPRWDALTWHSFERLPTWCALEPSACAERLRIAGAVALSPAVRRCLRGEKLLRLRDLIGAARLDALLRRPYRTLSSGAELADAADLEAQLLARGVGVLIADVDDPLAKAPLLDALVSIAGTPVEVDSGAGSEGIPEIEPCAGAIAAELHRLPAETALGGEDGPTSKTTVRLGSVRSR